MVIRRGGHGLGPIEPGVEEVIIRRGRGGLGRGTPLDVAESDFLSRCVRDFVYAQPDASRRALIAAFTQYQTTCDGAGRVVLERPLSFDSRERRARSDVAFTGTLSPERVDLALRVAYCGGDSASPDRITIVADDATWTSSRLEFERDTGACDVAELPYTRPLGRILFDVTDATDALIRFEGTGLAGELVASDGIKHELRVVLEALDALSAR
jgi:hypothetical protein